MDAFRTVVDLIIGVVWPMTVVWLAHTFRHDIRDVLSQRNARLKAGPFELAIEQARVEVEAAQPATPLGVPSHAGPNPRVSGLLDDELRERAKEDPAGAVLSAFALIERVLREKLEATGADPLHLPLVSGVQLAVAANNQGLITRQSVDAIQGVAVLRNLAAHGMERVDTQKAQDYLDLVEGVLYALQMPGVGPSGNARE